MFKASATTKVQISAQITRIFYSVMQGFSWCFEPHCNAICIHTMKNKPTCMAYSVPGGTAKKNSHSCFFGSVKQSKQFKLKTDVRSKQLTPWLQLYCICHFQTQITCLGVKKLNSSAHTSISTRRNQFAERHFCHSTQGRRK